jgi:Na+-transporting methylmalonyl-CoA/oxaloacetate decarboxylase gamma subunit
MGVVFLALTVLAVTAWILEKMFRGKSAEAEKIADASEVEAVIALALAYHTKRKGSIHIQAVKESVWMQQTRVYE